MELSFSICGERLFLDLRTVIMEVTLAMFFNPFVTDDVIRKFCLLLLDYNFRSALSIAVVEVSLPIKVLINCY